MIFILIAAYCFKHNVDQPKIGITLLGVLAGAELMFELAYLGSL